MNDVASGAAALRPTLMVLSRDPVGVSHRGNAIAVRKMCQFLRAHGMRVVLVLPSFRSLGRKPFERVTLPHDIFDEVVCYGGVVVGGWMIRFTPAVWSRAVRTVFDRVLGKFGIKRPPERSIWDIAPVSKSEKAATADAIARFRPSSILVNYFFLMDAVDQPAAHGILKSVFVHDLFFMRDEEFVTDISGDTMARVSREREITDLAKADLCLTVQGTEDAILREALPDMKTLIVHIGLDVLRPPGPPDPDTLMFVGSNNPANQGGLDWFLEQVWPLLRQLHPAARLFVYGDVANWLQARVPDGVEPVGRLPDLTVAYHRHALCVVPLRLGSGLKIKLVEALSHGRAVVTTDVGAQGLEVLAGSAFVLADDPVAFAEACADLLSHPDRRHAQEDQAVLAAERYFSAEACYEPLRRYLMDHAAV